MPSPAVFVIGKKEWKRARAENVYPEGAKVLAGGGSDLAQ